MENERNRSWHTEIRKGAERKHERKQGRKTEEKNWEENGSVLRKSDALPERSQRAKTNNPQNNNRHRQSHQHHFKESYSNAFTVDHNVINNAFSRTENLMRLPRRL